MHTLIISVQIKTLQLYCKMERVSWTGTEILQAKTFLTGVCNKKIPDQVHGSSPSFFFPWYPSLQLAKQFLSPPRSKIFLRTAISIASVIPPLLLALIHVILSCVERMACQTFMNDPVQKCCLPYWRTYMNFKHYLRPLRPLNLAYKFTECLKFK